MFFLPPYSPELNPDEWVWKNVKHDRVGKTAITSFDDLRDKAGTPLLKGLYPEEQVRVAQAIEAPNRIDAATIDHIETVLWRCIRQDDALGAQATLDTVRAQRNLVRLILPGCPTALRPRLLSLYSNHSLQAGWLLYDLNDFDSAS